MLRPWKVTWPTFRTLVSLWTAFREQNDALKEIVDQVRTKLLGAEIMAGLKKLHMPDVDLGAVKRMVSSAMAAVKQEQLGYALFCATKTE